jgi:hypothetical protein
MELEINDGERDEWPLPDHIEEWNEWWLNRTYSVQQWQIQQLFSLTSDMVDATLDQQAA